MITRLQDVADNLCILKPYSFVLENDDREHLCELFKKPHFIEKEVTGDIRYYNSFLMKNPYTRW